MVTFFAFKSVKRTLNKTWRNHQKRTVLRAHLHAPLTVPWREVRKFQNPFFRWWASASCFYSSYSLLASFASFRPIKTFKKNPIWKNVAWVIFRGYATATCTPKAFWMPCVKSAQESVCVKCSTFSLFLGPSNLWTVFKTFDFLWPAIFWALDLSFKIGSLSNKEAKSCSFSASFAKKFISSWSHEQKL